MSWDENTIRRIRFDYTLLALTLLLTGLGLTFVYSSSAVLAQEKFGDGLYFLKRMLVHAAIGLGGLAILCRLPYGWLRRAVYPLFGISLLLSLLTLVSPLGVSVAGAQRWLQLGFFTFQPSELARLAIILFLAYSLEKKREHMERFTIGILPNLMIPGILLLFVLLGKDLGSTLVIGLVIMALLFLGGARLAHLCWLVLLSIPILIHLVMKEGYRVTRILSFLNPWDDRLGSGFQIIQSLLAFNEGGIFGKGLGAGQQKLFYLPEAHTDFIFSVLGEELGLFGVIIVIACFGYFTIRGLRIAKQAPDLFGRYLAFGIVLLVAVPSLMNMGVVMGLLPTKGLVLPFLSYGGSSLVSTLLAVGVLLNISSYQQADAPSLFTKRKVG